MDEAAAGRCTNGAAGRDCQQDDCHASPAKPAAGGVRAKAGVEGPAVRGGQQWGQ